jgi:hypothetical protein
VPEHYASALAAFGDALLAKDVDCRTLNQGEAVRRAIELMVDHADGSAEGRRSSRGEERLLAERYNLVIFARMDLYFDRPITLWTHTDFAKFNFCLPGQ